jgi:hypothetical protein
MQFCSKIAMKKYTFKILFIGKQCMSKSKVRQQHVVRWLKIDYSMSHEGSHLNVKQNRLLNTLHGCMVQAWVGHFVRPLTLTLTLTLTLQGTIALEIETAEVLKKIRDLFTKIVMVKAAGAKAKE